MNKKISMMDFYIILVLVVFYIADAAYLAAMFNMGQSISDWWLVANVIIALVEMICCMIIKISQKTDKKSKDDLKDIICVLSQTVGAVAGKEIEVPSLSNSDEEEEEETEDTEEKEDDL